MSRSSRSLNGGNITSDIYKLAIPFGMLFAQQGIKKVMDGFQQEQQKQKPKPKKAAAKKTKKAPVKPKKPSQKGGSCGCQSNLKQSGGDLVNTLKTVTRNLNALIAKSKSNSNTNTNLH